MKSVRIYKDNVREHILRSLFFSDTVLFVGFGVGLALSIFLIEKLLLHIGAVGVIGMSIVAFEVFYGVAITIQIEKQPLYKLLPRAIHLQTKQKKLHAPQLDSTLSDFSVIGGYIKRKKELLAVYTITPFDIALLNEEEQNEFYLHMKMMLHNLPCKIQLLVQKRLATEKDYYPHFFSLYNGSQRSKEKLIQAYISDFSELLQSDGVFMTGYYVIFSTPLANDKEDTFTIAVKKLFDNANRLRSSLAGGQIQITQLENEELRTFCQQQTGGSL